MSNNAISHCSWTPELELSSDVGKVNLSDVLYTNRRGGMINPKWTCIVCGQNGGLKMKCDRDCSYKTSEGLENVVMHVTCARQAGLEVRVDDKRLNDKGGPLCYGTGLFCGRIEVRLFYA